MVASLTLTYGLRPCGYSIKYRDALHGAVITTTSLGPDLHDKTVPILWCT
jgi:hypothetical protein